MTINKKRRAFSLIAAAIYAYLAVFPITDIKSFYSFSHEMNAIDEIKSNIIVVMPVIALIGLVVALFMKNKKAVAFSAGVYALYWGHSITIAFGFLHLFRFLAYVAFVVIIILAMKRNTVVKKIWFIAGTLLFVGWMIQWIQYGYFKCISEAWYGICDGIIEIAGLVFQGMWIKNDISVVADSPVNEYTTFNPQGYNSTTSYNDVIGGADKLKLYKELLDSGTITQEEFDAKKKQILEL